MQRCVLCITVSLFQTQNCLVEGLELLPLSSYGTRVYSASVPHGCLGMLHQRKRNQPIHGFIIIASLFQDAPQIIVCESYSVFSSGWGGLNEQFCISLLGVTCHLSPSSYTVQTSCTSQKVVFRSDGDDQGGLEQRHAERGSLCRLQTCLARTNPPEATIPLIRHQDHPIAFPNGPVLSVEE